MFAVTQKEDLFPVGKVTTIAPIFHLRKCTIISKSDMRDRNAYCHLLQDGIVTSSLRI